jgi:hypothetical protein
LYSSRNAIKVKKLKRLRGARHVTCIEVGNALKLLPKNLKERDNLAVADVDGRIIVKWVLNE